MSKEFEWISFKEWMAVQYFMGKCTKQDYYKYIEMSIKDKTLEELEEILRSPDADDIDADLVFAIMDRINEMKAPLETNAFSGLIMSEDVTTSDLPEGLIELNKKLEENEGKDS